MRELYKSMVNINKNDYLECWKLYMDLVETEFNPENMFFYDWDLISYHEYYNELDMYKKNINDNMSIIIDIVENIVKNITNNTDGYFIIDNNILVNYDLISCKDCGNIWDGFSQCNCYNYN